MDKLTLDDYENNHEVKWSDIERRLMLNEHSVNPHIPDSHLWAVLEYYNIHSLNELFIKGFGFLSDYFLTVVRGEIYVKPECFSLWQENLTLCPPLILIAAYSYKCKIMVNVNNTAIISPYIEELEKNRNKFNDLHIHLNGSTETDVLWQDMLYYPNIFRKNYQKAFGNTFVIEQNEQEKAFQDSNGFYNLLEKARSLRYYIIYRFIFQSRPLLKYPGYDFIVSNYNVNLIRNKHPYCKAVSDLQSEYQMYVEIFQLMDNPLTSDKKLLTKAFHHYLLILGLINRFVTQQIHQNGFQQFQKITQNEFRSYSEERYKKRFLQLCGNVSGSCFKILEGRFAPKNSPVQIDNLIGKIRRGWYSFKGVGYSTQEIKLVCHFIKQKPDSYDTFRHQRLRNQLWIQANAIKALKDDLNWMSFPKEDVLNKFHKLVGIDAAASEFDAPPEVFSPIFRLLRRKGVCVDEKGVKNITFHAGEDFLHILTGLRVIYESIYFLDMVEGDRIGHATAVGVSPILWRERIGNTLYMSKGEWVDNLIFCLYILNLQSCNLYIKIETEIKRYFSYIYPHAVYSLDDLIEAWKCRKWDPEVLFAKSLSQVDSSKYDEWCTVSKMSLSANVKALILDYHFNKSLYSEKILIDFNTINDDVVSQIQQKLLSILIQKEIIIETLPTSNIRIGIYKTHDEHHIKRWINEDILVNNLKVVVGSDDTGIFVTNIYNEYAHIYMMYRKNQINVIKTLIDNGDKYLFSE